MEKMKFGTGGQPVALEDLELLQDNAQMLGLLVLESLTDGKAQQFLMRKVDAAYQVLNGERVKVSFGSGVLVVNNEFYPFAATELELSNLSAPVYICIQRNELDNRRFENNETKACRVKYSATLSATPMGEHYNLSELKSVTELLREHLKISDNKSEEIGGLDVTFKNGFIGKVTLSVIENELVISVTAESEQKEWSPDERGIVFTIDDSEWVKRLSGKESARFSLNNYQYPSFLYYSLQGAKLVTYVNASGTAVGFFSPTMKFNTTFTIPN